MEGRSFLAQNPVRMAQIIVAAMVAGVVMLTVVAVLVGPTLKVEGSASTLQMLRIACGVAILAGAVVPLLVRGAVMRSAANAVGDEFEGRAGWAFVTTTILTAAMLEGPALFGAVVVLLGGGGPNLVLVAVPLFLLIRRFPTQSRYESVMSRIRDMGSS